MDLVSQAAEVLSSLEDQATKAEKVWSEKLKTAQQRIAEFEAETRTARDCVTEARRKLREALEAARGDRARLQAAEQKISELEQRATTAEAKAKENSETLARIEIAIRTKILDKRPANKQTRYAAVS